MLGNIWSFCIDVKSSLLLAQVKFLIAVRHLSMKTRRSILANRAFCPYLFLYTPNTNIEKK